MASALAKGGKCVVEPTTGYVYHIRTGSISRVLELHHVEAMRKADLVFARTHSMDAKAEAAFARRTRSPLKAVWTALSDPAAVWHMGMPIAVRLRRLAAQFAVGAGEVKGAGS